MTRLTAVPVFEDLEPRLLLSDAALTSGVVARTADTEYLFAPDDTRSDGVIVLSAVVNPVGAEDSKYWDWSGSMVIPDAPTSTWVGIDCLAPGAIPYGTSVTRVSVHHEITHTWIGDLQVKVYNSAHTWTVRTNEGGSADDINETRTEYSIFDGDTPQQDWYYRVRDTARYDTGALTAMQLYVYFDTSTNNPPDISGIPDVALDEDGSFPSAGSAAPAEIEVNKLGFDGDTAGAEGALGDATPLGSSFLVYDEFGGTWWDAEKTAANTDDDLMCWAAAASNMLEWTGWGNAGGMTTSDQVFACFQSHWSDQGGMMQYGWNWWFSGSNPSAGWSGWSQVEVAGGNFWSSYSFSTYFHSQDSDSQALAAIDQFSRAGYGVTLGIYGPGGHAITCWGFNYNPSNAGEYYGLWITDSDDDKSSNSPPDRLRYYEVQLSGGRWYLQDYYGTNSWYIGAVQALDRKPGSTPPPTPAPSDIDLWDYASDVETSDDQLVFSIVGNTNANCGVSISGNRYIHVDPAANWYGASDVTIRVSDGAATDTDTFRITVNPVNDAPTIAALPDRTVTKNGSAPYTIYLPSYASDPETAAAALSYSIVGNTNADCGASIVSGLYISLAPTANWTGVSDVTVRVSDGQYTATDVFRVTVSNPVVDLAGAITPIVLGNPTGPGSYHLVQLRVTNTGNATASGFATMELWASLDGDLSTGTDDYKLNDIRPYVYLLPGMTGYYYFAYLAPGNIPAGAYDLIAKIDADDNVTESNETNNEAAVADCVVMRNPDLTVAFQYLYVPGAPNKGAYGYALLRVGNAGPAMAYGQADIQVWASTDGDLSSGTDDVLLTTLNNYWLVLPSGVSGYYGALFRLPSGMTSGSYSLMAVVDSSSDLAETNDTNNTAISAQQYPVSLAALRSTPLAPSPVAVCVACVAQPPPAAAVVTAVLAVDARIATASMKQQQQQSQPYAAVPHKQQQQATPAARTGIGVNGPRTRGSFASARSTPEWDVLLVNPLA